MSYTGKLHERELVTVVRDPGVRFGEHRVLLRTDGLYAVVDERKPMAEMTVDTRPTLEEATWLCARLDAESRGAI